MNKYLYLLLISCLLPLGCTSPKVDAGGSSNSSPPTGDESASCLTTTTYSSPVSVTGTATFFKRGLKITTSGSTVTKMTLSTPITSALPIRFAEIRVLNSSGTLVQCGKTTSTGSIKALDGVSTLTIPSTAGNYTVQVLSRSNHTMTVPGGKSAFTFNVSVKDDIYSNQPYAVSQAVTSSGSGSVSVSLVAYAREQQSATIDGAAFSIYNSIFTAYDYLAQNTSTSDLTCLSPRMDIYWKAGFNPAQYIYPDEDPSTLSTTSFYIRGQNALFIGGGKIGNVTSADTDHFDDSIIIHEFGHRVEDVCGGSDTQGGVHYGLYRIDPRLAWSEGWGNFFGTHIIKNNTATINPDLPTQLSAFSSEGWVYYLDTSGYVDSVTGVASGNEAIRLNYSKAGNNPEAVTISGLGTRYYDKVDAAANPGEGHFRESSISRSLFKITNTCSTCTGTNIFSYIWKAFERDPAGVGMGKSSFPFRSSVRFFNRLAAAYSGSVPAAVDNVLNNDEAQQRDTNAAYTSSGYKVWVPYGIKLVNNGAVACNLKIQPRQDSGLNTDNKSDQRFSSHFYYVDLSSLPGVTEINMTATKSAGTDLDIDLILYKETYSFDEDCANYNADTTCGSAQKYTSSDMLKWDRTVGLVKKISTLNSLSSSSKYLLNVRAYTTNKTILGTTEYTYVLTDQGGNYLCPNSTF